jgi:hypothetical protein
MANAMDLIVAAGIFIVGKKIIDGGALDGLLANIGGGGAAASGGSDSSPDDSSGSDSGAADQPSDTSTKGKGKGSGKKKSKGSKGSKSSGGTDSGGADTASTDSAGGGCDCTCMPMATQKGKFKIETAAGEDCYNHVYPASMAECETALTEVCAKRGGGASGSPAIYDAGEAAKSGVPQTKEPVVDASKSSSKKKKKKSNAAFVYMPEQIDPNIINILATYKNTANGRIKDSVYTWNVSNYI